MLIYWFTKFTLDYDSNLWFLERYPLNPWQSHYNPPIAEIPHFSLIKAFWLGVIHSRSILEPNQASKTFLAWFSSLKLDFNKLYNAIHSSGEEAVDKKGADSLEVEEGEGSVVGTESGCEVSVEESVSSGIINPIFDDEVEAATNGGELSTDFDIIVGALTIIFTTDPSSTVNSLNNLPSPIAFPFNIHLCESGEGAVGSWADNWAFNVEMVEVEEAEIVNKSGGFVDLIVILIVSE